MNVISSNANFFEKIIAFLSKKAETPKPWRSFHIVSLILIVAACVLVVVYRRRFTEKAVAYITLFVGVFLTAFEVYKQLVMTYEPAIDEWVYKWYIFPFQFCSTPIYLTLLAFVFYKLKKKAPFEYLMAFLGTYSLVAGAVVLIFPHSVFSAYVGVNIQTMLHHGLMIVLAVLILSSGVVSSEFKTGIKATTVFLPLVFIAIVLNKLWGEKRGFDLFYLTKNAIYYRSFSELFGGRLPVFLYVIGYVLLFALAAFLVLYVSQMLSKLWEKKISKKK